jgi:hypothetical protein
MGESSIKLRSETGVDLGRGDDVIEDGPDRYGRRVGTSHSSMLQLAARDPNES